LTGHGGVEGVLPDVPDGPVTVELGADEFATDEQGVMSDLVVDLVGVREAVDPTAKKEVTRGRMASTAAVAERGF
jgi:hypothetical protein